MNNWWLTFLGILLIVVELLFGGITGLDVFILGLSFVVGGSVIVVTNSILFGMITVACVFIAYGVFFKKSIHQPLMYLLQRLGIDCIVGKQGVVVTEVTSRKEGFVFFDGEIWKAWTEGPSLRNGIRVMVTSVNKKNIQVVQLQNLNQEV